MMTPSETCNAVVIPTALPLFPRLCLMLVATPDEVEDRMGDLEESYANALAALGPEAALHRYRRDIASCILAIASRRLENLVLLRFLDRGRLLVSLAVITLAFTVCYGIMSVLVPNPWWIRAGLHSYPGQFRGINLPDYPVCQAWTDYQGRSRLARDLRGPGVHVAEVITRGVVRQGAEQDLSILLPRTAKVTAIYCGITRLGATKAAVEECSRGGCGTGVAAFVDDSAYAKGRVLTLAMSTRSRDPEGVTGHFWVAWRDETADAP
ncbi:hypothetical protein UAJ10_28435 [Nitrospirillum sp. BR 11164]|uniref:hypothetical protein n=1 Tax=Nitrospirillum sp. BR 11164 TaxID=3104324 RepID=UPI002AFDD3A7|nr:hypothetical protein [Nitrospirillum sp. BR 11164]MEA1652930.1 hypothetical protein [Nitrospirillum sp. BR 11164]